MKCLFLGGPADGQWFEIDTKRSYYHIPEKMVPFFDPTSSIFGPNNLHQISYTYRQELLMSKQHQGYIVYVFELEEEIDIVDLLLKGYRR